MKIYLPMKLIEMNRRKKLSCFTVSLRKTQQIERNNERMQRHHVDGHGRQVPSQAHDAPGLYLNHSIRHAIID